MVSSIILYIQNNSLGYKLNIILKEFKGSALRISYIIYPQFTEIESTDEETRQKWYTNRQNTYQGSFKHFLKAIATTGEGVTEVVKAIQQHHNYLIESGEIQQNRQRRCSAQLEPIVEHSFIRTLFVNPEERKLFLKLVDEVNARKTDPYTAAERLILHLIQP